MDEQLEHQAEAVLNDLLDIPVNDREAFARKACGDNAALLARVKSLAKAVGESDGFLGEPTLTSSMLAASTSVDNSIAEKLGSVIDSYKLLQKIGEGGFGIVYLAEQLAPVRRKVAVKIIKPGMDTREVIARFEAERQALAMMDHSCIARVFDAGTTPQGRPYFVMELVNGDPITFFCDLHRLTPRQRLELMVLVCRAVQSAHNKGIIHRDLKPNNVLVTLHDGKPAPKLIDFGIAKATSTALTEKTLFTAFGGFVGTPAYMSPEQAQRTDQDVDTGTDVYSLGVLLYELLTGSTPLDSSKLKHAAYDQIVKIIRENEPLCPSTRLNTLGGQLSSIATARNSEPKQLGQIIRGELDWIVMKALEKDRKRRYETAAALADDLERYLRDEPVSAGPPSGIYQVGKFARRHRTMIGVTAGTLAVLLMGLAGTSVALVREQSLRKAADAQRVIADEQRAAALADRAAEERERQSAQAVINFICQDVLAGASPEFTPDKSVRDVLVKNLIDPAISKIDSRFANQPLTKAAVQQTLAYVLRRLGRSDLALPQAKAALAQRQAAHGDGDIDTLLSLHEVASELMALGRLDEAQACYQNLIKQILKPERGDLAGNVILRDSFELYATLLLSEGRFDESEQFYKQELDWDRRVLGNNDQRTIQVLRDYSMELYSRGKLKDAEVMARQAWESSLSSLGPQSPATSAAAATLAMTLNGLGRNAEALPLARASWKQWQSAMGDDHPATMATALVLGTIMQALGQNAEAQPMAQQLWERHVRKFGNNNPATISAADLLATVDLALGKSADALPIAKQGWESAKVVFGPQNYQTIQTAQVYASVLHSLNRGSEADAILKDVQATQPTTDQAGGAQGNLREGAPRPQ